MTEWNPAALCETCGKGPFDRRVAWEGHQRSKGHPNYSSESNRKPVAKPVAMVEASPMVVAEAPTPPPLPAPAKSFPYRDMSEWWGTPAVGAPAIIPEWRQVPAMGEAMHAITMLRPMCRICEHAENRPADWWWKCPHDPYITMVKIPDPSQFEEIPGQPGKYRELKEKTFSFRPMPNAKEVAVSLRINSGNSVIRGRVRKGYIYPEDLRSPVYPGGVASACEYRMCRKQTGLVQYRTARLSPVTSAWFCRLLEAQLVWHDAQGTNLIIGEDPRVPELRDEQLARAAV